MTRQQGGHSVNVLVTGGTGYLGSAIVRALARRGHHPVVFARHASSIAKGALPGSLVDGDVRDRRTVLDTARHVDAVCHSAALVSMWQPDRSEFDRVNVGGLETVIDVSTTLKIRRLIYTSSFLALPPAGRHRALEANDYQRSKVRAREIARAAANRGVPIVSLVPGVLYGRGVETEANLVARLIREHLAGSLPGVVGGNSVWSFASLEDVAEGHVTALEEGTPGEEYMLGGENLPQRRLFELLRGLRGTPLPRFIPPGVAWGLAWLEEHATRRRPPRLTTGTVKILRHDWPLDSTRSVEKLSYRITPLSVGIEAMLAGLC